MNDISDYKMPVFDETQKELMEKITDIKKDKNILILAHNYQPPEIQEVADMCGDSFELAAKASKSSFETIVFCGVDFMAESAKLLSPEKTILIPDMHACCPMAHMVDINKLIKLKNSYHDFAVVAYVNTTAQTKAISDVCCTSSSAIKIISKLPEKNILFVPDINLASYVQSKLPEKNIIPVNGHCHVHNEKITPSVISVLKEQYPEASVALHPECSPETIALSDFVGSTSQMIDFCKTPGQTYIIGTEYDMCYRIKKANPGVITIPVSGAICHDMKRITLESLIDSMLNMKHEILLSEDIMKKARHPLDRMLVMGD